MAHFAPEYSLLHFCGMEPMQIAELTSALCCLLSVWLNTKRRPEGWPIGLVSVVLAGLVYYDAKLLAECALQLFYLISGIYGWRQWLKSASSESEKQVSALLLSRREAVFGLLYAAVGSVLIWFVLRQIPEAGSPLADALLTGFSLLAQFWLARRRLENWLLWMAINFGSVLLYLHRELWFFAVLYLLLFMLAVRGYIAWKKTLKAC